MRLATLLALSAGASLCAAAAQAQDYGNWYVRGDVGPTFQGRADGSPDFKGDTGWAIDGAVGRSFAQHFRAEAEVGYADANVKGARPGGLKTVTGFANGYYDINPNGAWQPFVGAGIGVAQVKVAGADDTGFAYQLKAGLAHPFTDRLTGELAYRYRGVSNVKAGVGADRFDGDYHDQAVTVGLRYTLGR